MVDAGLSSQIKQVRHCFTRKMVFREWSEVEAAPESPERDALLQFRSSITPQETDPATSLRFLRARNLNAAKANAMFFEYLNWRNIERVDGILTETVDSNVRLPGPASACIQTGLTGGSVSAAHGRWQQFWPRALLLAC